MSETQYEESDAQTSKKASRELRELADGNLDDKVNNRFLNAHAGLTNSDDARMLLDIIARAWEPRSPEAPRHYIELPIVEDILASEGTELAQIAIQSGNMQLIDAMMGLTNYDQDIAGVKVWSKMRSMITSHDCNIWYYFGHMGSGKTFFARNQVEQWKLIWGDYRILSNTPMPDAEYTYKYSEIKDVLEERQGKDNETRLMVFIDEAAQLFSGFGGGISRGEDMAQLLKLGRKADADFIFIGQDGKDITAQIRALCTVFVHKTGKKSASFFKDVHNREGVGKILSVKSIPLPEQEPDTKDVASLVFDLDGDDEVTREEYEREQERWEKMAIAAMDFKSDLSQQEIAELYGTNPRQIRRWKKQFKEHIEGLGFDEIEYPDFD